MPDQPTVIKAQWEQNKAQFERLCDEQENLYNPKFERVFTALYEIAPDQREVYNTNGWNMSANLPDAIDTDLINRALAATGASDEVKCGFTRYAEIVLQGKRLMQQNALLNIEIEINNRQQPKPQPEGWRFCPINIFASTTLHTAIVGKLEQDAQRGEGLFSNITEIAELPDEALDEFLSVEVYNIVCSLQPFLGVLKQYGVTGQTLGKEFTRYLFAYLKQVADYIKDNTDKPEAVKSHILQAVKAFDNMPIWGLIFQILTLQGLLCLLGNCTLKEGENGYNEAQELCNWITKLLGEKIVWFTLTGDIYGDEDKKRLQPLCDYLYNTEIGRAVQDYIFNRPQPDPDRLNEPSNSLPDELNTPEANKYFARAVERGYMTRTATGYKWSFGGVARLGYFVEKVFCPNNTERLPEQAINRLFGVQRIGSAITQVHNAKKPQKWQAPIDQLFIN